MCIIAIFKNGKRPDRATIKRMMATNRDGVGIAWNTGKQVYFHKGYTTAEQVEKMLSNIESVGGVRDIVFHARIGTSGGVSAEKCHPYPLTGCAEHINRTTYAGGAPVVFHNGVFSIDIENGLNDSQTFIKNMLYPIYKNDPKGLYKGKYDRLIEMAVRGSRLVIMYPDGWRAYGSGWQEEEEAWYSNSGYKAYTPTRPSYYWSWDAYDDYYDETYFKDWDEWKKSDTKKSFYIWRRDKQQERKNAQKGVTS